jgi:DNA-binding transcriptional MocR family regulator
VANEQVIEHMTKLAETSTQHTATSNAVAQEVRLLRSGLGREVRREVREVLSSTRAVDERS